MSNDVEDLILTALLILSRMDCPVPARLRIGHENDKYEVDVVVEVDGELNASAETGTGTTLAQALRSLLWAMQKASSTAHTN